MFNVTVDETRCQGHARCLAFAPDVFDFDDEGYAFVPEGAGTFDELPEHVRKAVASCPERAIVVSEDPAP
jgi:ferredoxin